MAIKILKHFPVLKKLWRELVCKPNWFYTDSHKELEGLFKTLEDPWNFESSQYEKDRFAYLVEVIKQYTHGSILEIGCAEGIFTEYLTKISQNVTAFDISPTAIERAKKRCPKANFYVSSLQDFSHKEFFDVVVCAETLYYIKDVQQAIEKLKTLGKHCVVSYLNRETKNLDKYLSNIPGVITQKMEGKWGLRQRSMSVFIWENKK